MVSLRQPSGESRLINAELGIEWSNWDWPTHLAYSQRAMIDFWPTAIIEAPGRVLPLEYADRPLDLASLVFREPGTERSLTAGQMLDRRLYNDALLLMYRGKVVHESWRNGMCAEDRHVNHSTTKSLTTLLLGQAISDGLVDPEAPITEYLEMFRDLVSWNKISVQQALDMRTGLRYEEHYEDPDSICWSYFRATGYYPPQAGVCSGFANWVREYMNELECEPGEKFNYASPVTNALALVAASAYGKTVPELLEEKIYRLIGAEQDAWLNLDPSGVAVTEGQISLSLRDFARWAGLFLDRGRNLAGEQVVPANFIADIHRPRSELRKAWKLGEYSLMFPEGQYRNQTYVLDGECTQLAMLGIHGQFALIDLSRELLMVGYGSYPNQVDSIFVQALLSFWEGIRAQFQR